MKITFRILQCAFLYVMCSGASQSQEAQEIIYTRAFADNDYGNYHVAVLQAALNATSEYGTTSLAPNPNPMTQSRQLVTLLSGHADIMWCVTSIEREQNFIPIKLPLLKGFAGYRVFVINPERQRDFDQSISGEKLKAMTLVQGVDWPDLDILQSNGYTVSGEDWSSWFHSMYSMVDRNLVDAFPRNVIEVHRDLARHSDKNVVLEQNHLLNYPSYEFFFVSPTNTELANRVRLGLIRILENGELNRLFDTFEGHQQANEIVNSATRIVHELSNPAIPYTLDYAQWDQYPDAAIDALKRQIRLD